MKVLLCQKFKLRRAVFHYTLLSTLSVCQKNTLSRLHSKYKFPCFKFVWNSETGEIKEELNFCAPSCTTSMSVFIKALLSCFGGGLEVFVLKEKIKYWCALRLRQQQSRSVLVSNYLYEQGHAYVDCKSWFLWMSRSYCMIEGSLRTDISLRVLIYM